MATPRRPQRSATIPAPGSTFAAPITVSWSPPAGAQGDSTIPHPRSPTMVSPTSPIHISTSMIPTASPHVSSPAAPFEPRIIRGNNSRLVFDAGFGSSRTSPVARHAAARPSVRRLSQGVARQPSLLPSLSNRATTAPENGPNVFPRPAYLEQSVLRDFLQTDQPLPSTSVTATSIQLSRLPLPAAVEPPVMYADPLPRHIRRAARADTPATDSDDESFVGIFSRSSGPSTSSLPAMSSGNPVLRLPTRWSEQDRHTSLTVSQSGRELTYHGPPSHSERDSAAARTNHPIPPACGIYYYEVDVLQRGVKGFISVGFSAGDVRLSRLPGWEKKSWGYHGDDGNSFAAEKNGQPYGPTFGTGDVIGCGIDFSQNRAFYTKNGLLLPFVFDNIGRECELYPSVGLRHPDEQIRANFGHQPFRYDIDGHAHQQREAVWTAILGTPLSVDAAHNVRAARMPTIPCADGLFTAPKQKAGQGPEKEREAHEEEMECLRPALDALVLGYLTHHGYAKSAKALQDRITARTKTVKAEAAVSITDAGDTEMGIEPAVPADGSTSASELSGAEPDAAATISAGKRLEDEMEQRTLIVRHVLTGDPAGALTKLECHFPQTLMADQGLLRLKLRCADFVTTNLKLADLYSNMRLGEDAGGKAGTPGNTNGYSNGEGNGAMDVDQESLTPEPTARSKGKTPARHVARAEYDRAVAEAITYGRDLQAGHKDDVRPEVRMLLTRTFSVMAFNDPRAAPGDTGAAVTPAARAVLAEEVNAAILQSQGRHGLPAFERAYSQAQACVAQLGLMGVGAAAYADVRKELLD